MYAVSLALLAGHLFSSSWHGVPPGAEGRLDPKIPPPDAEKYKFVRDAPDWANPYLVVRADGVDLISKAIPGGRKKIAVKDLHKALVGLPVSAWPYGRVVAVSEISIRSGNDDELVGENAKVVDSVLHRLGVNINRWPS
jgi:hypothetical protein